MDPSAWCDQCIAESIRCIDRLPEDFYDEKEPDEDDEELERMYHEEKRREGWSPWHWWSPDASWSQW